jgi:hypothetical protein
VFKDLLSISFANNSKNSKLNYDFGIFDGIRLSK